MGGWTSALQSDAQKLESALLKMANDYVTRPMTIKGDDYRLLNSFRLLIRSTQCFAAYGWLMQNGLIADAMTILRSMVEVTLCAQANFRDPLKMHQLLIADRLANHNYIRKTYSGKYKKEVAEFLALQEKELLGLFIIKPERLNWKEVSAISNDTWLYNEYRRLSSAYTHVSHASLHLISSKLQVDIPDEARQFWYEEDVRAPLTLTHCMLHVLDCHVRSFIAADPFLHIDDWPHVRELGNLFTLHSSLVEASNAVPAPEPENDKGAAN